MNDSIQSTLPCDPSRDLIHNLAESNVLALENGFICMDVSDLEGFGEALDAIQGAQPLIAVSDTTSGTISANGSPYESRLHTVFLFMPHPLGDGLEFHHRRRCFSVMREITRQFMSVLFLQQTRIALNAVAFDHDVTFEELDAFFFSGGAAAFFQFQTVHPICLQLVNNQWTKDPIPRS